MRRIERTNAFRRDFKREKRGRHRREVERELTFVISLLVENKPLPETNRNHALAGEWRDHQECHIKPESAADLPEARCGSPATGPTRLSQ